MGFKFGFLTDIFDANSEEDKRKRRERGEAESYEQQQRDKGNKRPTKNVGEAFVGNTLRFLNTAKAGAGGAFGLAKIGAASVFGDDEDYERTVRGVDETLTRDLNKDSGLFRAGTMFDDRQDAEDMGTAELLKKSFGGGLGVASEVLPAGRPVKGASLTSKVIRGAARGAAEGTAGSAGSQLVLEGEIDPREALLAGAFGGAVGGTVPAVGAGLKRGAEVVDDAVVTPQGRINLEEQSILRDFSDMLVGANKAQGRELSDLIGQAQQLGRKYGIDLTNGSPAERLERSNAVLDQIGGKRQLTPNVSADFDPLAPKAPMVDTGPVAAASGITPTNPIDEPFDEILGAVTGQPAAKGQSPKKGLAALREEQESIYRKERGERFGRVSQEQAGGSEGYFKELSQLKGEHSKVDFTPMIHDIGPERAEELFTAARAKIKNTPDDVYEQLGKHPEGARLNTQRAVRKVLGLEPGLPTRSELKLLSAFSPKLADEIEASIPKHRKIFDAAATIFGSARAAKSTGDLSMGGRQGLFVAARHPVLWARANKESVKYAGDSKYFKQEMKAIHEDEWGQLIDKYNPNVLTGGKVHEEPYAVSDLLTSDTAKKVGVGHVVAGAERAYTGGLTKLRKDILEKNLKAYGQTAAEAEEKLGSKGMQGLIEAVSTLTGRGGKKGGWVEKHATTLQEALFSPRLWASRLQPLNPAFWNRIGPAGRKEALQSLGSFAAVAGVVLTAAAASGADVETDPRSSDFLKIKVGDTRYDILGGFQQNLVFGARQALGFSNTLAGTDFNTSKSSQTGQMSKYGEGFGSPTQLSAAFDLVRNKANPIVAAGANIIEGQDKAGNDINPLTEIGQLFVPIGIQSMYHAAQRENPTAEVAKTVPEFFGIGSQTYGVQDINLSDTQKEIVGRVERTGSKEQAKAYESFFKYSKLMTSKRKNASEKINEALEARNMTKAQQIARDYNEEVKKNFQPWRKKFDDYKTDELLDDYNSLKINLNRSSLAQRLYGIRQKESAGIIPR